MKKYLFLTTALLLLILPACDSFVEEADEPIDSANDAALNDASQVPFLITGVQARFAQSHDNIAVLSGLLSDEQVFGDPMDQLDPENGDATFPTFRDIDFGEITRDNNSTDGNFNVLGEYRFLADRLLERIEVIDGLEEDNGGFEQDDPDDDSDSTAAANAAALRNDALYTANLHGGIARYFLATYYSLTERGGGATIAQSAVIPPSELYGQAIEKMTTAQGLVGDGSYEDKLINSLLARIELYTGDFDAARSLAEAGLVEGDDPFQSLHSVQSVNFWFTQAGVGRQQVVAAQRFTEYLDEDSTEAARIPLRSINPDNGPARIKTQDLYPTQDVPINFMSWQENELMLAELDLRDGDSDSALERFNAVRASSGLSALESASFEVLVEERDKELFTEGQRLIDQRRFDGNADVPLSWHLESVTTAWYLPISQQECNDNQQISCETLFDPYQ